MRVEVNVTASFKKAARPLIKRYRSFIDDLAELERDLRVNPKLGTALGGDVYKIRLKIKSKGKGKSGGARVISLLKLIEVVGEGEDEVSIVNLLTVYDKSDKGDISDAELKGLVANLRVSRSK